MKKSEKSPAESANYFREWYEKNREEVLNKRRKRYREDPEYAERCRQNARGRKRTGGKTGPSKERRPVSFSYGGKVVSGWTVSHLAKRVGRSVPTIRNWVNAGSMPESPIRTDVGHRLYTDGMILVVRKAVNKRGRIKSGDQEFYQEIVEGWVDLGVQTS